MKRAIPNPRSDQIAINTAVKENLEQIMGQRLEPIKTINGELASTATTAELAARVNELTAKINEIIARLQ